MKKYIWTYWTKPQEQRKSFFDLACLGLSTSLVKKHGYAYKIYTDKFGAAQIQNFNIDVDFEVSLESLEGENIKKFALAKIDTYQKINFECAHIDYDVFLWDKPKNYESDFTVQSLEQSDESTNFDFTYKTSYEDFKSITNYVPAEIKFFTDKNIYSGYNMGYVDIKNLEFFNKYANIARKMFDDLFIIENIYLNCFVEQLFFYCMTQTENIKVSCLLTEKVEAWDREAANKKYTHLMGEKIGNKYNTFIKVLNQLKINNIKCYESIFSQI